MKALSELSGIICRKKGVTVMTAETDFITGSSISDADKADDIIISGDNESINRLIAECASSSEALEKLYRLFRKSVFALAFSITSDYHLAEDSVIETFVRLTQVRRFDAKKGDGRGFIHKIARNVALEFRRSFRLRKTDSLIQNYGETDKIVENSVFIEQLLRNLTDKQKQIVVMKIYSGLTFREIAEIMRCPESTIKSRYTKAMKILKEKAGENGG